MRAELNPRENNIGASAKPDEELRLPSYGGQAVMEGVLMRGKRALAMSCRAPNGEIVTIEEELPQVYRSKWMHMPFIRGVIGLWDALNLGMVYLTKSANIQSGEDEKLEGSALVLTILVSLALGIGIFFILPALAAGGLERLTGLGHWWSNLFEGLLRLLVLVGYMAVVRRIPEIGRTFMYHGAEHKTINAFEARLPLTPENVQKMTTVHPRCGTAFMLSLVLISVLFFSLLGPLPLATRLLTRLLLLPVVSGIAYEYIRFTANHMESPFIRALIKPNLLLQRLTTIEPTLEMLEVSISAFEHMYTAEQSLEQT